MVICFGASCYFSWTQEVVINARLGLCETTPPCVLVVLCVQCVVSCLLVYYSLLRFALPCTFALAVLDVCHLFVPLAPTPGTLPAFLYAFTFFYKPNLYLANTRDLNALWLAIVQQKLLLTRLVFSYDGMQAYGERAPALEPRLLRLICPISGISAQSVSSSRGRRRLSRDPNSKHAPSVLDSPVTRSRPPIYHPQFAQVLV